MPRLRALLLFVAAALLVFSCRDEARPAPKSSPTPATTPLEVEGFRGSQGATPGNIDDAACKECHQDLYGSYQEHGMARSFYRPTRRGTIEDLTKTYVHARTGRHYAMEWRDDALFQKRWRVDAQGRRFGEFEAQVAWIIGSGNHVRTYLSQNEHGELFELPLSWYRESGWGMSPGYDVPRHFGFERRISRHCMFCHNAYPELPAGADAQHKAPTFPAELPHGIGCQRCHGPGAQHVARANDPDADDEDIRAAIHRSKTPDEHDRLCNTCHLQPEVLADGQMLPQRFDAPLSAHRPDRDIRDFVHFLDHGTTQQRQQRLEINHHAYRLRWSECFTKSGGKLSCVTCHDPHRKVAAPQRAELYRSICLQCHDLAACKEPRLGAEIPRAEADCVECHMAEARPADVVHATVTDHFIRRQPRRDLAAPREEVQQRPPPKDVIPYFAEQGRDPAWPLFAGFGTAAADSPEELRAWRAAFEKTRPHSATAYVIFGAALGKHDRAAAIEVLREGVKLHPKVGEVHGALGRELWRAGRGQEAVTVLEQARALAPKDLDILQSLSIARLLAGDLPTARQGFEQALAARPNDRNTWIQYADTLVRLGDREAAAKAYASLIDLDPDHADAYVALSSVYSSLRRSADARRVLEQGGERHLPVRLMLIAALSLSPALRDEDAALRLAQRTVREHPADARCLLHLCLTQVMKEQLPAARETLRQARKANADAACCTGLEFLIAKRAGRTDAGLLQRFAEECRAPLRESLRPILQGYIRSLTNR